MSQTPQTHTAQNPATQTPAEAKTKPKRTAGLWVVDNIVYTLLNNIAVFSISVVATYLTNHGQHVGGKFGKWMHNRGNVVMDFFQEKFDMNEDQAKMGKMVFFSFLDGSLMAPFVKMIEDRREIFAKKLDKLFGTLPEDESVYQAEPKQTWKSLLLGRAAVAGIIVPTAVLMDKLHVKSKKKNGEIFYPSLNEYMFTIPGEEKGEKLIEKSDWWEKKDKKYDIKEIFGVAYFEAFYTAVCTLGLYFTSRIIARFDDKKKERKAAAEKPENAAPVTANAKDTVLREEQKQQENEAQGREENAKSSPRKPFRLQHSKHENAADYVQKTEEPAAFLSSIR